MAKEAFLINPPKRASRRRFASKLFGIKRNPLRRRRRRNPLGSELMLVGSNPFHRRSGMSLFGAKRRKRRVRKNRVKRRRKSSIMMNPYRRVRRRRNPSRKRYRRNPPNIVDNITKNLPAIGTVAGGLGGLIAVRAIPRMLGVRGIPYYGVQLGVVAGGGWALHKANRDAAIGFIASSAALAIYDILKGMGIFGGLFTFLGLGEQDEDMLAAYPEEQYAAYPDEGYDTVSGFGDYQDNL